MKTVMITLVLFGLLTSSAHAQSLPNATARKVVDGLSWGTVGADVLLQTLDALHCADKTPCLLRESVQVASVLASVWSIKGKVDSPRPCASFAVSPCTGDDARRNIPSGHSALSVQAAVGGDHQALKWTLAGGTIVGRLLSGKHDWKGITSGAGVGFGWTLIW